MTQRKPEQKRGFISFGVVIVIALIIGIFLKKCTTWFNNRVGIGIIRIGFIEEKMISCNDRNETQ